MSSIINIPLNFTKADLLAELRSKLADAKRSDREALKAHREAEKAYLEAFRSACRQASRWSYETAKENDFQLDKIMPQEAGYTWRRSAPACPIPLAEKIESAIAMVEMSNQTKYTLDHNGRGASLYALVTADVPRFGKAC